MILSRLRRISDKGKKDGLEYSYDELAIPRWLNVFLGLFMRIDELLIKLGFSLPIGGSLFIVAKKD